MSVIDMFIKNPNTNESVGKDVMEEDNIMRTQSMIQPTIKPNDTVDLHKTTLLKNQEPIVVVDIKQSNVPPLNDPIIIDHNTENNLELSGGDSLRKLNIDEDEFDEDLRKLYDQNEKMLLQAKTMKRLSDQLLK
jgi:hypothetical protein